MLNIIQFAKIYTLKFSTSAHFFNQLPKESFIKRGITEDRW